MAIALSIIISGTLLTLGLWLVMKNDNEKV